MGNLLIVDDEPDILESLEEMFKYESGLDLSLIHICVYKLWKYLRGTTAYFL